MPTATTTTTSGTAAERTVAMSAANAHALAYAASKGWGPARTLSALGHPGYGRAFAAEALERIAAGAGTHEAVYGLLAARSAR
jgi:hypothetical protein